MVDHQRFLISTTPIFSARNQLAVSISNMDGYPMTTPKGVRLSERLTFAEALQMLEVLLGGVPPAGERERLLWERHHRVGDFG